MEFCIAIDGPAAAGKGTLSRAVAAHFGFAYLDTGLLYRAVGRRVLEGIEPLEAAKTLTAADLEADDLRGNEVSQAASKVAAMPEVRAELIDFQRAFSMRAGGAVLDGRDIGTVICPEARVKLFVTASPEVRAKRRFQELRARDGAQSLAEVLEEVKQRDSRDMERSDAPLKPAEEAIVIDTSEMSIQEATARVIAVIEDRSGVA